MIHWNYMLVAAGGLLVFVLFTEWTRKNKAMLFGRITASLLAVMSLLFMAYPYAENKEEPPSKKIIVLTEGFIKDSVENFLHQTNKKTPVFSDAAVQMNIAAINPVQLVTDWALFASKHNDDTIHVFGNGLSAETLALLNPHPIVFHGNPAMPGISHIYWKQDLQPGEPLTVQGHYENTSPKKIKIALQAFGAAKDSVFMDAFSSEDFALHTIPLHNGRAVYSLIAVAGKDTLEKEPVPAEVQATAPLQLLIISSSPDFENTFLKNHLSQQGYQITVNTVISTNKTNKQFLNTPQQPVSRLTVPYLTKFDVLIADEEALQKMSTIELAAIRSVVEEKGTGLLIQMDAEKNAVAFYSKFFPVKILQQAKESFLQLRSAVSDSNRYTIKITDPFSIAYTTGTQVLLQDGQSNIYASCIAYGSGKIVATTLQNTYSIALEGNKTSYQQLWWLLLNKAAKKIYPGKPWQTNPFVAYVNNPAEFLTATNDEGLPKAVLPGTNIYLKQDALLPFQWEGKYWPLVNGWQQLPQLNMLTGNWYVYKTNDWKQLNQYDHLKETKRYAWLHPVSLQHASSQQAGLSSVNWPLLMLLIFLISNIFLWVEQKRG